MANGESKILHGARVRVSITDPNTNQLVSVGIFARCGLSWGYEVVPAYTLGRFSPAETEYTASDLVMINAQAWRVINYGPHVLAMFPRLQDLLNHKYLTFQVIDRKLKKPVHTVRMVRPARYNIDFAQRDLSSYPAEYVGILADDESGENNEAADSTFIPG